MSYQAFKKDIYKIINVVCEFYNITSDWRGIKERVNTDSLGILHNNSSGDIDLFYNALETIVDMLMYVSKEAMPEWYSDPVVNEFLRDMLEIAFKKNRVKNKVSKGIFNSESSILQCLLKEQENNKKRKEKISNHKLVQKVLTTFPDIEISHVKIADAH